MCFFIAGKSFNKTVWCVTLSCQFKYVDISFSVNGYAVHKKVYLLYGNFNNLP